MRTVQVLMIVMLTLGAASCRKTQPCIDVAKIDSTRNCSTIYDPVCGCDDYTYFNPCDAERSGVVSWIGGPCL